MIAYSFICDWPTSPTAAQEPKLELCAAGQPVVEIELADVYDLGQEFFRWEIATAVAGSILRINPFNQPDVEASKIVTRQLTEAYEKSGKLPQEAADFRSRWHQAVRR